jgi:hypothetical protein
VQSSNQYQAAGRKARMTTAQASNACAVAVPLNSLALGVVNDFGLAKGQRLRAKS